MNKETAYTISRIFMGFAGGLWLTLAIASGLWYFIAFAILYPALTFYLSFTKQKIASIFLYIGAFLPAIYGFMQNWELGVWGIMSFFFFIPTILSAYYLSK